MIKTQNLTPEIYYRNSRDFQLFGRLYDVIFNYAKTNVDLMENFPINRNTDSRVIELLARTLGFQNNQSYRNDDLNAICNIFIKLMRQKGSIAAINTLTKTILNIEGINKSYDITVVNNEIYISIPDAVSNPEIKLFEDVLEYILPIGMRYNIQTVNVFNVDTPMEIKVSQATEIKSFKNDVNNSIARTDQRITTSTKTTIGNIQETLDPLVGDIRYSQVKDSGGEK